jgi:hypothetical protein
VIVSPIGIVLARLDQRDVEGSEARANVGQIRVVAGASASARPILSTLNGDPAERVTLDACSAH